MKKLSALLTFVIALSFVSVPDIAISAQDHGIKSSYGKLPLYFIKNDGQVDKKVEFYEKGSGHATYFTKEGVYLSLRGTVPDLRAERSGAVESGLSPIVKLSFIGANENPEIIALDEQAGKVNYLIGNDPSKWRSNIPTFSSVLYKDVYNGIDIKFYGRPAPLGAGTPKQLEYDIIVSPGADPNVVKFSYDGIEDLKVTDNGDLEIALKEGKILQKKPYIYQEIDSKRKEVVAGFVIEDNSYSFSLASYNATKPLVIDPVLDYSTYLGGNSYDYGYAIAIDSSGNAYVTGTTLSSDFPTASPIDGTANGSFDVFVTKLNASGTALDYSTFLGGSDYDYGRGIAIDSSGNAYVTGWTSSSDFPTASPFDGTWNGGSDGFVTKLDSTGSVLTYSTFLGGNSDDYGRGIAIDSSGNAYVTGWTWSSDFPTVGPIDGVLSYEDAFVAKLNPSGSALVYSTYLGGGSDDYGYGIAVAFGNVYVTGATASSDFPTTASAIQATSGGGSDVFVTELNSAGSAFVYSTYLGGSGDDSGYAIAVDSSGNTYVTGGTDSIDFPLASATQGVTGGIYDAFVSKISTDGSTLVYSTYLGGGNNDYGLGIA
ncbi:MAG: SBBP repeat-containing protein, partial [Deltaproteobacteria bacterium]|nr:SBBP repeat-containing protein [Deltaproteobacteria bacterium]